MLLSKYIKNSKEISKLNSKTGVKETPPQRRYFFVVVVILLHLLSHVQLFVTPWTAAYQCPLSSTVSWSLLTFMSIESMMVSTISCSATPFSFCLQSFPVSGFFPVSQLFTAGGQSIGASASASVFPENIQGSFLLRLTSLISLQYKRLSRSSAAPQFKSINSLALSLFYGPALISIHKTYR